MRKFLKLSGALVLIYALAAPSGFARNKEKFLKPAPIQVDREGGKWAEKTLKKLTLEEKVGQLFMIWARVTFMNVDGPDYLRLRNTMRKYHIGSFAVSVPVDGPFLLKNEPYEMAMLVNQLQRDSQLPLIMAADFERGVSMRLNGTPVFPHPMAFGAAGNPDYVEAFGRATAQEARALGIHWNFFPIADVNSNPLNPIINTRSFGEDPQQVGELISRYIKGAHEGGMLTTAKHFPGHGDTATDSHLGVASVNADLHRLQTVELPPFRKAIEAGVDSVMVAHVTVPAIEPDSNKVATTSEKVITELLKQQLGFKGVVITDAMDMNGLMRLYSSSGNSSAGAAVAALKAGNDVLLIPQDLDGAYKGVLAAVQRGEISQAQIDASVLKILRLKASLGLHHARLVDIDEIAHQVDRPENVALGQKIADSAVTLVRDDGQVLPLKRTSFPGTNLQRNPYTVTEETTGRVVAVIFSDDLRMDSGRSFERELRTRIPEATVFYVDPRIAAAMSQEVLAAVAKAENVIVPVYVIPTPGKTVMAGNELKNTVSLADATGNLLHRVLETAGPRTVVVAMGNPYVGADFPEVQNYVCTFSSASVSEVSAVKALFGEIPIGGHLPVTIPDIARRGAGIMHAQVVPGGTTSNAKATLP
ncbi:MAG TPA: glycoside hydrolase family 3 protein [Terriglobales bacterium]|nr:glycoside hydrolase family 3 protein [Terriglobales bacterium]